MTGAQTAAAIGQFNGRAEIRWFGFRAAIDDGLPRLVLEDVHEGKRGAGTGEIVNGGVISAAFDAVSVLAVELAQTHLPLATVHLAVNFVRPFADPAKAQFGARIRHAGRSTAFVDSWLEVDGQLHASANAILRVRPRMPGEES